MEMEEKAMIDSELRRRLTGVFTALVTPFRDGAVDVPAFERLIARLPNLRLTPVRNDFAHYPGFVLRGLKELHLSFDPA